MLQAKDHLARSYGEIDKTKASLKKKTPLIDVLTDNAGVAGQLKHFFYIELSLSLGELWRNLMHGYSSGYFPAMNPKHSKGAV